MPTFNGISIFGFQVKMTTGGTKRRTQRNEYFGVDGSEEIDGGFVEHQTVCSGRLEGSFDNAGLSDLIAAIIQFRTLFDGSTYALVDNYGNTWNNVKMTSFELNAEEGIVQTPNEYYQRYTATFVHLSLN